MKIANLADRVGLDIDDAVVDVATASGGRFGPDPMDVYLHWEEFVGWAADVDAASEPFDEVELRCPVPRPRQVFAIGLNYRSHAEESVMAVPDVPATFTSSPPRCRGRSTTSRSSETPSTGRSSWWRSSAGPPTASPKPTGGTMWPG